MRKLLWSFVGLLVAALPLAAGERKPNIIFILADDLGWGDLGCYGQKTIKTPNLDRMAKEGIRFTQVYAGSTVCAPSRCVLMTGLHTGHARVRGNGPPAHTSLRPEDVTIASLLKRIGYVTAVIGKWGLGQPDMGGETGVPSKQGFDESFGFYNHRHAHNYYPSHLWRNEKKQALRNVVEKETADGAGVASKKVDYAHDLITEDALSFVKRNKDRPFFLYWCPTIPHANNEAGKNGMEVPELGAYAKLDLPAPARAHAAMVSRMDRDIGRLLQLLADLNLAEDTILFFTSDNGPHREGGYHWDMLNSNGPLRGGKRDLYEGGLRVPMIVWSPGRVPAGKTDPTPWAFWDVLPTLADIAGARTPANLDGLSVAPLLRGKSLAKTHDHFYWEFHERGFHQAVRIGDWKAVRLPGKATELYDIARDLGETKNVAAEHPDVVRRAEALFRSSRTESPHWPAQPKTKGKKKAK